MVRTVFRHADGKLAQKESDKTRFPRHSAVTKQIPCVHAIIAAACFCFARPDGLYLRGQSNFNWGWGTPLDSRVEPPSAAPLSNVMCVRAVPFQK